MKLYHSSNCVIENPDTVHSRDFLDFGKGFYLTHIYEQAERYAARFKNRGEAAYISDETEIVFRGEKNACIVQAISELYGIEISRATDIFYRSQTSSMIENKIADLHCRSNKYLATIVMDEYRGVQ